MELHFRQGQVEVGRLPPLATADFRAVHGILTVDITILASGADFRAAAPRIPFRKYILPFYDLRIDIFP